MKNLKYFILSVVLIIIGFILYKPFFEFSVNMINNEKIEFFSTTINSQFRSQLIFAIIIGLIPILYMIIQRLTKIHFFFDGVYVLLFILIFGCLSSILRGVYIINEFS